MTDIAVEIVDPRTLSDMSIDWTELTGRSTLNAFMDPAGLNAVQATGYAKVHVLLAWDRSATPERLVGLWALRQKRSLPFFPSHLTGLPHNYTFLSNPVVDPSLSEAVLAAFFAAIRAHRRLPKVLRLQYLDADDPSFPAIRKTLLAEHRPALTLTAGDRPFASRDGGVKRSGSTRKKLRQDWNRLNAAGAVALTNERDPASVREAFEIFLQMEAAGWKGDKRTALLSRPRDRDFVRRFIADLAAAGSASVALLRVDERPIAAQVLLYCGTRAYTWKIAYDAEFSKFSPGALLVDKVTELLFETTPIRSIESCSPEGGFMWQMWSGRRATADLLIELRPHISFAFAAIALAVQARGWLKAAHVRLRTGSWPDKPRNELATPAAAANVAQDPTGT